MWGSFRMLSGDKDTTVNSDHTPFDYQKGDYTAILHPVPRTAVDETAEDQERGRFKLDGDGVTYPCAIKMVYNEETQKYELNMPINSGAHEYQYLISYLDENGNNASIILDDPENPGLCCLNEENNNYGIL